MESESVFRRSPIDKIVDVVHLDELARQHHPQVKLQWRTRSHTRQLHPLRYRQSLVQRIIGAIIALVPALELERTSIYQSGWLRYPRFQWLHSL